MTLLRPAKIAVACTLVLVAISPAHARADNNIQLTVSVAAEPTSRTITASPDAGETASTNTTNTAFTNTAPRNMRFHRRLSRHSAYRRSSHGLTSRGVISRSADASSVVGRLAIVTQDNTSIRAGRDRYNRVLSVVPKGQYLAINSESPTKYGVLMIDRSIGYVAKSDVQMLDYQVVTNAQPVPDASEAPTGGGTLGQQLVQTAQQYLGVPYVWGGNTKDGIDCSGFVKAVFAGYGISLPRHSGDQAAVGYDVPRADVAMWVPGDRMYFACHHPEIDHTGMYIGQGYFIHASAGHNHQVAIDRVENSYYYSHLVAVRRSKELLGDPAGTATEDQTAAALTTQSSTPPPPAETAGQAIVTNYNQTASSVPTASIAPIVKADPESTQQ